MNVLKVVLKIVAVILAAAILIFCAVGISYVSQATRNKATLSRKETRFVTDEIGDRIANIPYNEYIADTLIPKKSVIPDGLSSENSGEKNGLAIQDAIDCLSADGGGIICIPKGKYKTNTIQLKDNITMFISYGAELISLNYDENIASDKPIHNAVIYAENAKNIKITGGGTINGEGLSYTNEPKIKEPFYALEEFNTYTRVIEARKRCREAKDTERNNIINFYSCTNVEISNVILKDSAVWTCVLDNCVDVNISDVIIDNNIHIANSDGIDILGGEHYSIEHCFIATGDDGIVLKPIDAEIKNVYINDCIISSCANCFKIGTETQKDVSDVYISNCYFFIPNAMTYGYAGIAIESCDGSNIKNINASDITMDGVSAPFLIWLGNRFKYDKQAAGSIDGVVLKNITATDTEMPSAITGCVNDGKTHYVKNVILENVNAVYRNTGEALHIRKNIGEYTSSGYPDITRVSHVYFLNHNTSKYWDLPCYSLCIKHAQNVDYAGYNTTPRSCNEREEFYIDDVK